MDSINSESVALSCDELKMLQALLVSPRAGFAKLAAVLEVSEATVARRYRTLVRRGVVRVVGVVDTGALGQSRWVVRLQCRPGSTSAMAEALARRDDVSWLALADGSELAFVVRPQRSGDRNGLLGTQLSRHAAVLGIQASVMLHRLQGGRHRYWSALQGGLTHRQEAELGSSELPMEAAPVVQPRPVVLDADDRLLADLLSRDGRASMVDLARASDSTAARAAHRLKRLQSTGALYFDVEISAASLGYRALANLWLQVDPPALRDVGRRLVAMPQIGFAAMTSGPQNMLAVAHCRDLHELFELSADRVGALSGIRAVEVSVITERVKQIVARVDSDGLLERP